MRLASYTVSMRKHASIFFLLLGIIALIFAIGMYRIAHAPDTFDFPLARDIQKTFEDVTNSTGSIAVDDFVEVASPSASSSAESRLVAPVDAGALPPSVRIQVPFLVQAPTGNWNMPYQEACEEASLIMVHQYFEGTSLTAEQADKEILDMVAWENAEFNYSADVTVEELKRIAEDYYQHRAQLFYDFTIADMKRLLAEGHPIILPVAGRDIGNPYFSGEGPWYHMLVVTGYEGNVFITNDPGTRRGEGYRYPQQRLFDAIHNWTGAKEDIRYGKQVMMVLER